MMGGGVSVIFIEYSILINGKINPITGLEGSRRLRLPDFKTIGT
jgi:hypothetical protein